MSEKPFLSIIMPVYNAEQYLKESISSILNQQMQDFELILVNDCSTDNSGKMCDDFAEEDERIVAIHLEKNGGAGNARNVGICNSKGEYITFVDSDDFIEKDIYELARQTIEKKMLDMVVWGITEEYYDKMGKCYCKNRLYLEDQVCAEIEEIKDLIIQMEEKTLFGYQWNRLYRAEIIKKNNIQFEKVVLYEDYFFNLKVVRCISNMAILSNCGYHYMKRTNGSITTRFVPEYFELSTRRIETMYQLYCDWNYCNANVKNILGQRYLRYILAAITKSFDHQSGFDKTKRKELIREIVTSNIYKEVSKHCNVKGILNVLRKALNNQNEFLCLQMGRIVWIMREKASKRFNRIRKYK